MIKTSLDNFNIQHARLVTLGSLTRYLASDKRQQYTTGAVLLGYSPIEAVNRMPFERVVSCDFKRANLYPLHNFGPHSQRSRGAA